MAKVIFLLACVAFFQIASALECYHCVADDCAKDMKQWQKTPCAGNIADKSMEAACLKLNYKDKLSNQEKTTRKCAIVSKMGEYQCPTTDGTPVSCPTCKTDLCNSAQSVSLSIASVSGVLLSFFLAKLLM